MIVMLCALNAMCQLDAGDSNQIIDEVVNGNSYLTSNLAYLVPVALLALGVKAINRLAVYPMGHMICSATCTFCQNHELFEKIESHKAMAALVAPILTNVIQYYQRKNIANDKCVHPAISYAFPYVVTIGSIFGGLYCTNFKDYKLIRAATDNYRFSYIR